MKLLIPLLLALAPTVARADKVYLHVGKGNIWDCAIDPVIYIRHGNGHFVFKGACKAVTIEAGKVRLSIESVETLAVNGNNNDVTVGILDTLTINGSDNMVRYKTAKSGDVKSDAQGTGNTLLHIR